MSTSDQLEAENTALREQIEAYRHRELAELREQLASAKADVVHYRSEAQRNADIGQRIYTESQLQIEQLRARIQALEAIPNARVVPTASS